MKYGRFLGLALAALLSACSGGGDANSLDAGSARGLIQTGTDSASSAAADPSADASTTAGSTTSSTAGSSSTAPTSSTSLTTANGSTAGTGSSTAAAGTASNAGTASSGSNQPSLAGSPPSAVLIGTLYSFTPKVTNAPAGTQTFSIVNCPAWASFDTTSGTLSGTPDAGDVGTFSQIAISVSMGGVSASTALFAITVTANASGTVALTWVPPTQKLDGSPLPDLAGYRIYYGTNPAALTQKVDIGNSTVENYVVGNLTQGLWYFAVKAYSASNIESAATNLVSKTVL